MSRISIDVSPEEHKTLKAVAALKGKTMKDYLLEGKLPAENSAALGQLEVLLDKRISAHQEGAKKGLSSAKAILSDILGES